MHTQPSTAVERNDPILQSLLRSAAEHRIPFAAALALNVLAWGYLLFTYVFTNHTFPNLLGIPFPSFHTEVEGRWGFDLVYAFQGGNGIPMPVAMLAIPLQILNGILFARLLDLRDRFAIFVCAALVSLHPFVADYYSFSGDHLNFVVGDTLVLTAFLAARQSRWPPVLAVGAAGFLLQLALACYQPKISLIATVFVLGLLRSIARWDGTDAAVRDIRREVLTFTASIVVGLALYLVLLMLTQWWLGHPGAGDDYSQQRMLAQGPLASLVAIPGIFAHFADRLVADREVLPPGLQLLPGLMLAGFAVAVGLRSARARATARTGLLALLALAGALLALPLAVYASFLASPVGWELGRFHVPFAYVLAFLVAVPLGEGQVRALRWPVGALALLLCWRFVTVDAQMGHLAYLRSVQELHFMNRLTQRIEAVIDPAPGRVYSLAIVGDSPIPDSLLPQTAIASNLNRQTFMAYRQVELLNYLLGRPHLQYPTRDEVAKALELAAERPAWPAAGSVFVADATVVAVLQPAAPGVTTTEAFR